MTNQLIAFSYQDAPLRVELDTDGEPLFHAGDLCAILEYANPWDAISRHADGCDLVKREVTSDSESLKARKTQIVNFIREPGMWSLVLGSETAAAKRVKRWVVAEVLPSIRKTGGYQVQAITEDLAALRAENAALKRRLTSNPKPSAGERRQREHDRVRDRIAASLARRPLMFAYVDRLGRDVLHKASLAPAECEAIAAGLRQMGYEYSAPHDGWRLDSR